FLPPLDGRSRVRERLLRSRDALGLPVAVENIAVPTRDSAFVRRYHDLLTDVCRTSGVPVLLDIENLRIDARSSGLAPGELLDRYDGLPIHAYHVAGGDVADGLFVDSHRHATGEEALGVLASAWARRRAPVV